MGGSSLFLWDYASVQQDQREELDFGLEPDSRVYKGIALFTPGGDVVYCIDPQKRSQWHLHLCAVLQELLGLPEPPHFLVPTYTATVDRWIDPRTQELKTAAELSPLVRRHQAFLNGLFKTPRLDWTVVPFPLELDDPVVMSSYRRQFPQLWETHDWVVRFDRQTQSLPPAPKTSPGFVFRLFIGGQNPSTERTLQSLHQLLEQLLRQPYTLKIIDILKHPEQAELNLISATPTLVKVWPEPVRRIVGELDNLERVLQVLGSLER